MPLQTWQENNCAVGRLDISMKACRAILAQYFAEVQRSLASSSEDLWQRPEMARPLSHQLVAMC